MSPMSLNDSAAMMNIIEMAMEDPETVEKFTVKLLNSLKLASESSLIQEQIKGLFQENFEKFLKQESEKTKTKHQLQSLVGVDMLVHLLKNQNEKINILTNKLDTLTETFTKFAGCTSTDLTVMGAVLMQFIRLTSPEASEIIRKDLTAVNEACESEVVVQG
jgi:hypothetical protein